jgi:hypothetical protein
LATVSACALWACFALAALPVAADSNIGLLPAIGERIVYRVERTVPGANGAQSAPAVVVLEHQIDGSFTLVLGDPVPLDSAVVQLAGDGSLVLGPTGATTADANLRDVVYGLDLALAATANIDQAVHGVWQGNIPIAQSTGAATATVSLFPANVSGSDFDFSGSGEAISAPTVEASSAPRRSGRGARGDAEGPAASDEGELFNIRVDGKVVAGRVVRIAIAQSRSSIATANAPAVTLGSWSVTVLK